MARRARCVMAAALTSVAVATPLVALPTLAHAATSCAPVQILGFRGSGEGQVADGGLSNGWSGGMLERFLTTARTVSYTDGFQTASVPVFGVDYPAIAPDQFASLPPNIPALQASVAAGVQDGLAAIQTLSAGCTGHTSFVLIGYSQGMIVAHELALAAPAGTVGGVFGVGDPDQKPGAHGVTGAGSGGNGMYRFLGDSNDAFYSLPLDVATSCHAGDPICDFSFANATSSTGGALHTSYGADPTEASQLGRQLADVAHSVAGGTGTAIVNNAASSGGKAVASSATAPVVKATKTVPVPKAATKLHVTRTAKGAVAGTAVKTVSAAKVPDGTVVTIQGRANSHAAWKTVATTKVRKGAFSSRWPSGRTPSQLRAVLSAGSSWTTSTATIGAFPKR